MSLCDPLGGRAGGGGLRLAGGSDEPHAQALLRAAVHLAKEGAVGDGGWASKKIARHVTWCAALGASPEKRRSRAASDDVECL